MVLTESCTSVTALVYAMRSKRRDRACLFSLSCLYSSVLATTGSGLSIKY